MSSKSVVLPSWVRAYTEMGAERGFIAVVEGLFGIFLASVGVGILLLVMVVSLMVSLNQTPPRSSPEWWEWGFPALACVEMGFFIWLFARYCTRCLARVWMERAFRKITGASLVALRRTKNVVGAVDARWCENWTILYLVGLQVRSGGLHWSTFCLVRDILYCEGLIDARKELMTLEQFEKMDVPKHARKSTAETFTPFQGYRIAPVPVQRRVSADVPVPAYEEVEQQAEAQKLLS